MKKLIDLFAIMAIISLTTFLVGCGDDDDDDDDDAPPPQTQFAPASVANHVVTLTEGGQTRDVQFAAAGSNFTQFETGSTNAVGTGSFQYSRLNNNNGQLILTTTDAQGATVQVTYNLAFTSASGGTYTFTSSTGQTGSGTFSNLREVVENGGGNGDGDGDGNGDGDGDGNGGGEPPTAISGRAIDFTASGAGNERLTFATSGNSVTSDAINPPNNVGTYTFTPGTGGAPSNLVVTFPNGDTYNLTMTFTDATHGSWSGNQFFDNSDHPVPAGSSFTIQP